MQEGSQTLGTVLSSFDNKPMDYLGPEIHVLQDIVFTGSVKDPNFPALAKQLSEIMITRASLYMHSKAWLTLITSSLAVLGTSLENDICGAGLSVAAGILCAFQATQWYRGYQYRSFAQDLLYEVKDKHHD